MPVAEKAKEALGRVVEAANADVMLFNAPLERHNDRRVINRCHKRRCRPNLLLFLITHGGDPDAAYRIARCLQSRYEKFTCCISGYCKSAGTLLLLGANEIAYYEQGELGPLDIQLAKKDELWESESGLTVMTALTALHENAQEAFDHFFLSISTRSGGRITVRTASEIAANLTGALFSPISQQIDPIHMGEVSRSMAIAREYGTRLMRKSKNFDTETLNELISNYPSHGFVIDGEEAQDLFKNVRSFTQDERVLVEELGSVAHVPSDTPTIEYLSDELEVRTEYEAPKEVIQVLEQSGTTGPAAQATGHVPQDGQAGAATIGT